MLVQRRTCQAVFAIKLEWHVGSFTMWTLRYSNTSKQREEPAPCVASAGREVTNARRATSSNMRSNTSTILSPVSMSSNGRIETTVRERVGEPGQPECQHNARSTPCEGGKSPIPKSAHKFRNIPGDFVVLFARFGRAGIGPRNHVNNTPFDQQLFADDVMIPHSLPQRPTKSNRHIFRDDHPHVGKVEREVRHDGANSSPLRSERKVCLSFVGGLGRFCRKGCGEKNHTDLAAHASVLKHVSSDWPCHRPSDG